MAASSRESPPQLRLRGRVWVHGAHGARGGRTRRRRVDRLPHPAPGHLRTPRRPDRQVAGRRRDACVRHHPPVARDHLGAALRGARGRRPRRERLHPLGHHVRRGHPDGGGRLRRPLRERRRTSVRPGGGGRGPGGAGGPRAPTQLGRDRGGGARHAGRGREAGAGVEHPDGAGRLRRFARPHLRAAPHQRHRRRDRPRRAGLGRAVLLPGMRRHLASAAGAGESPLTPPSGCPTGARPFAPARSSAGAARPRSPDLSLNESLRSADTLVRRQKGSFETGMPRSPVQTMSSNLANFWRSYVYIGVLTYSMGALAVVVYSLTTPGSHRHTMVILGFTSLAASIGPFRWIGLRLVSTRWSKAFFTSWAACTFAFIGVGAVLDGGVNSPISYFLVLPMLFAGLAYSAGTVSVLASFGVLTILAVGVLTPESSWGT